MHGHTDDRLKGIRLAAYVWTYGLRLECEISMEVEDEYGLVSVSASVCSV